MYISNKTAHGLTLSRVAFPTLVVSFIATLVFVQNPLLNVLLIAPLILLLALSAKQISGSATYAVMVMVLSLGVGMLNIDRIADQSVELYKICESQMSDGGAVAADVAEGSNCAERYIAPGLWRFKA